MTMSPSLISTILTKAEEESNRRSYPEGFPELPLVPAARYADPAFAELERTLVFGKSWLFVAHTDELPDPGDYRLVEALPEPIVLIRGHDGRIRAFYNTCKGDSPVTFSLVAPRIFSRFAEGPPNWEGAST